jgi:uncharacterized membrane protein YkvA (DUF1232 family)
MMAGVVMSLLAALVFIWLALLVALLLAKPEAGSISAAARLLPDTLRLVRRLAADRNLNRGVRVRLWLLLAYLVSPIDLVPDVIPVIGFADDAIVTSLVLRSVIRRSGTAAVECHWPGTPEGLAALLRLCRLPQP